MCGCFKRPWDGIRPSLELALQAFREQSDIGSRNQTRVLCTKQILLSHSPGLLIFLLHTQTPLFPNTAKTIIYIAFTFYNITWKLLTQEHGSRSQASRIPFYIKEWASVVFTEGSRTSWIPGLKCTKLFCILSII